MGKLVRTFTNCWILLLTVGSLLSCGDDEGISGLLPVVENSEVCIVQGNKVIFYYPLEGDGRVPFHVMGAEGGISSISVSDEKILSVGWASEGVYLNPLAVGEVTVTIKDESGHEFTLNVENVYREEKYTVEEYQFNVRGHSDFTESKKYEIINKAQSMMPVQIGGGYQFIFTDWRHTEGIVNMYPNGWDGQYVAGTFRRFHEGGKDLLSYELQFDDKLIHFASFYQNDGFSYFTQTLLPEFLDEYPDLMILDATQCMSGLPMQDSRKSEE